MSNCLCRFHADFIISVIRGIVSLRSVSSSNLLTYCCLVNSAAIASFQAFMPVSTTAANGRQTPKEIGMDKYFDNSGLFKTTSYHSAGSASSAITGWELKNLSLNTKEFLICPKNYSEFLL